MKPIIIASFLLFAVIAVGLFFAWPRLQTKPVVKTISQSKPKEQTVIEKPIVEQNKIAYIKENIVYTIDQDGTNKTKIFQSNGSIRQIVWKNSHVITYISCSTSCTIRNANIGSESNVEIPESENQILTFGWNHAGDKLAYIYKLSDGEMKLNFKSGSDDQVVKTFAVQNAGAGGRESTLDDNVSIYFSPDDKNVLVTNTLGQSNNIDQSTIWVFDSSGKELLNIKSDTNSWATQARWWGSDDELIYKQGNQFYSRELNKPNPINMTSPPNFFNPVPTIQANQIVYWVNTTALPYLGWWGAGSPPQTKKLIDGFYKPEPLDEVHIIGLKAQKAPEGQEVMSPFVSGGISKIDLRDKKVIDLDSGDINLFAVSP